MSRAQEERFEDDITPRDVARTLADTGIRLTKDQIAKYAQALREDKILLTFHGDAEQVGRAHEAL